MISPTRTTMQDLPNEIIQHVLQFLPPRSLPCFQRACKRFNLLADQAVWREKCRTHYRYWRQEHHLKDKLAADIYTVNWRGLFIERQTIDQDVTETLNSILNSQVNRIEKAERILTYGYDAKDCLLQHYRVKDDAEDVLARRYHSDAILGAIHRGMATREWSKIKTHEDVVLERALAAYDMFVLRDRHGDLDDVSQKLDSVAAEIRTNWPDIHHASTRKKALVINQHLRSAGYIGHFDPTPPQSHKNSFIGITLFSEGHSSLPLIACAIYCAVARRLGVDAQPCGIPWKVIVIVKSPEGRSLDSDASTVDASPSNLQTDADDYTMYLFPSASEGELSPEVVSSYLSQAGVPATHHSGVLTPTDTSEIVQRCARNLSHALNELTNMTVLGGAQSSRHGCLDGALDTDSCFYAALWALLVLIVPDEADGAVLAMRRRNFLPNILELLETRFIMDIGLFEQYLLPLFENTEAHIQLREHFRVTRATDSLPKTIKRRSKAVDRDVRYRVGQVFRHRRYDYKAVITGWDVECAADEDWILQMRIDELPGGRRQGFYHVLVEDKSTRYVAEENIQPVQLGTPGLLGDLAGRYFKRWDETSRRFISNMVDEYPDD